MFTNLSKKASSRFWILLVSMVLMFIIFPAQVSLAEGFISIANSGFEDLASGSTIPGWTQVYGTGGIT